jgi:phosphate transport system substrate-binding protein
VKWLTVTKNGVGSIPTGDDYPIARSLYGYTIGEPAGAVKEYIDWCRGDEAQAILEKEKFVPLPAAERTK